MNGYKCFYRGKTLELYAETTYSAQKAAAEKWHVKPNRRFEISVMLCEKSNGERVLHAPVF